MTFHRAFAGMVALLVACGVAMPSDGPADPLRPTTSDVSAVSGEAAAGVDLSQHAPRHLVFSEPDSAVEDIAAQLLERRYGIRREVVEPGRLATPDPAAYVHAYNRAIFRHYEGEHGRGLLDAIADEARLVHEIRSEIGDRTGDEIRAAGIEAADRDFDADGAQLIRAERTIEADSMATIQTAYEELLHDEFDARFVYLREADRDMRRFVAAYNDRMDKRLVRAHGAPLLERLARKAVTLAARRDADAGRLRLYVLGLPTGDDAVYQRLLKEQFGIDLVLLGCIPSARFDIEVYNATMQKAIEHRFGARALERVRREAGKSQLAESK